MLSWPEEVWYFNFVVAFMADIVNTSNIKSKWNKDPAIETHAHIKMSPLNPAHLAQVDDEAVPLVEACPGKVHLRGSDGPATLDMQQALHVHVIGHNMLKTWSHTPFLQQTPPADKLEFRGGYIRKETNPKISVYNVYTSTRHKCSIMWTVWLSNHYVLAKQNATNAPLRGSEAECEGSHGFINIWSTMRVKWVLHNNAKPFSKWNQHVESETNTKQVCSVPGRQICLAMCHPW